MILRKKVSILNAGDVGKKVSEKLLLKNYFVYNGSRQKHSLDKVTKEASENTLIRLDSGSLFCDNPEFFRSSVIIIILPFKKNLRDPLEYSRWIELIVEHLNANDNQHLIFISSTSIYSKRPGIYTEESTLDLESERATALKNAEDIVVNSAKSVCILRPSGIVKTLPTPKRMMIKKRLSAYARLNLVHIDDLVSAIVFAVEKQLLGIYNITATIKVSRYEYYQKWGVYSGFNFDEKEYQAYMQRLINNEKIRQVGFSFEFPDPRKFLFETG